MSNQQAPENIPDSANSRGEGNDTDRDRNVPNSEQEHNNSTNHELGVDGMLSSKATCLLPPSSSDEQEEKKTPKKKIKRRGTKQTEAEVETRRNKRALTNLAPTYCLHLFDKNLLIIFNQYTVTGYLPREGTEMDVAALKDTWARFGFETTECYHDLTKAQILKQLRSYANRDFTDYGCIVVAVLTHGTFGGELMAADDYYSEHDILNSLKTEQNPTLVTKPVLVLIQACRGTNSTKGASVSSPTKPDPNVDGPHQEPTLHYHLPVEADTLVFHSSYPGKLAWRPKDGSWFIQTLCSKIIEMADTDDLESIMIEVKREVACDRFAEWDTRRVEMGAVFGEEKEIQKQMPVVSSALQRKLFLVRKVADTQQQLRYKKAIGTDGGDYVQFRPVVSLRSQLNTCESCYIDHMDQIRNCLRHFVNDKHYNGNNFHVNPNDGDDSAKLSSLQVIISSYLQNACISQDCNKYMYFHGNHTKGNSRQRTGRTDMIAQTWAHVPAVLAVAIVCVIVFFVQKLFFSSWGLAYYLYI